MQGREIGMVLVAAALVAAVVLWSLDVVGGPGPHAALDRRASTAPAQQPAPATRSAADAAPPADVGAARAEAGIAAPAEGLVAVRVVGADALPVPGAVVHYGDPSEQHAAFAALPLAERRALRFAVEQQLTWLGTRVVADGDGVARWPARPQRRAWWQVVARDGDRLGETWIAKDAPVDTVHVLRLQRDVTARVRVLDERHQPVADVGVVATLDVDAELPYRHRNRLGASDENGDVVLHHVQLWSGRIAPCGASRPVGLGVDVPGVPPAVVVDAAAMPAEPIVLFVPPTGAIDVLALDAYGAPRANERIALRRDGADDDEHVTEVTTGADGTTAFVRVGLGHSWRVGFAMLDPEQHRLVTGPRLANERVLVRFEPAAAPMLTGRVVHDGAPAGDVQVGVAIDGKPAGIGSPRTDALGRFRVAVAPAFVDRRVRELALGVVRGEASQPGARGVWRGDLQLTQAEHALGDVVLETVAPEPVLVEGALVGADGVPPPATARVGIQAKAPGELEWRWTDVQPRGAADGTFRATGAAPAGELRLCVFGGGFAPVPPVPFVAGARGVRIELRRGGSLRATALVGTPVAAHCLEPLLVPVDAATPASVLLPFSPQLDSRVPERGFVGDDPLEEQWLWPALAPGRYRLDVRARGATAPLLSITGLVVADGERNDDPRMQHLRLPGVFTAQLTITLPPGMPPPPRDQRGFLFVLDGDCATERCVQLDTLIAHLASVRPIDVLVRLPGCRDRTVRGITGDTTIVLERGIAVVVRSDAPAAGARLQWTLTAVDDLPGADGAVIYSPAAGGALPKPYYRTGGTTAPWAADGATFHVPAAGRHRVTATVRDADGTERSAPCSPAELAVGSGGGTFAISLQ